MRENGTCKFWNTEKGFGFILRTGQPDAFVHVSDLQAAGLETLTEGQSLQFDIVAGKNGKPKASNLAIGLP